MSKGLGELQQSIIEFYENNYTATTNEVIQYLRTNLKIESHISSIYRSMKLLKREGFLMQSETRNLWKGVVPNSQLPTAYKLDKNSDAYKKYKKRKIKK